MVGRVSDPEQRPILFDREALIARLEGDERIAALREALEAAEQEAYANIARLMTNSTKPVDQRKIDFTRGYFAGAKYWLGGRMSTAQARLAAQVGQDIEESDA